MVARKRKCPCCTRLVIDLGRHLGGYHRIAENAVVMLLREQRPRKTSSSTRTRVLSPFKLSCPVCGIRSLALDKHLRRRHGDLDQEERSRMVRDARSKGICENKRRLTRLACNKAWISRTQSVTSKPTPFTKPVKRLCPICYTWALNLSEHVQSRHSQTQLEGKFRVIGQQSQEGSSRDTQPQQAGSTSPLGNNRPDEGSSRDTQPQQAGSTSPLGNNRPDEGPSSDVQPRHRGGRPLDKKRHLEVLLQLLKAQRQHARERRSSQLLERNKSPLK